MDRSFFKPVYFSDPKGPTEKVINDLEGVLAPFSKHEVQVFSTSSSNLPQHQRPVWTTALSIVAFVLTCGIFQLLAGLVLIIVKACSKDFYPSPPAARQPIAAASNSGISRSISFSLPKAQTVSGSFKDLLASTQLVAQNTLIRKKPDTVLEVPQTGDEKEIASIEKQVLSRPPSPLERAGQAVTSLGEVVAGAASAVTKAANKVAGVAAEVLQGAKQKVSDATIDLSKKLSEMASSLKDQSQAAVEFSIEMTSQMAESIRTSITKATVSAYSTASEVLRLAATNLALGVQTTVIKTADGMSYLGSSLANGGEQIYTVTKDAISFVSSGVDQASRYVVTVSSDGVMYVARGAQNTLINAVEWVKAHPAEVAAFLAAVIEAGIEIHRGEDFDFAAVADIGAAGAFVGGVMGGNENKTLVNDLKLLSNGAAIVQNVMKKGTEGISEDEVQTLAEEIIKRLKPQIHALVREYLSFSLLVDRSELSEQESADFETKLETATRAHSEHYFSTEKLAPLVKAAFKAGKDFVASADAIWSTVQTSLGVYKDIKAFQSFSLDELRGLHTDIETLVADTTIQQLITSKAAQATKAAITSGGGSKDSVSDDSQEGKMLLSGFEKLKQSMSNPNQYLVDCQIFVNSLRSALGVEKGGFASLFGRRDGGVSMHQKLQNQVADGALKNAFKNATVETMDLANAAAAVQENEAINPEKANELDKALLSILKKLYSLQRIASRTGALATTVKQDGIVSAVGNVGSGLIGGVKKGATAAVVVVNAVADIKSIFGDGKTALKAQTPFVRDGAQAYDFLLEYLNTPAEVEDFNDYVVTLNKKHPVPSFMEWIVQSNPALITDIVSIIENHKDTVAGCLDSGIETLEDKLGMAEALNKLVYAVVNQGIDGANNLAVNKASDIVAKAAVIGTITGVCASAGIILTGPMGVAVACLASQFLVPKLKENVAQVLNAGTASIIKSAKTSATENLKEQVNKMRQLVREYIVKNGLDLIVNSLNAALKSVPQEKLTT